MNVQQTPTAGAESRERHSYARVPTSFRLLARGGWLVAASEFATVALVQLYRYRRVSSPRERQQTKWVIFGLSVPIVVNVMVTVLYLIFPMVALSGSLFSFAYNVFGACWPLLIPLSFGFAMLRSRLWDIDVLINRTLAYGALTLSLTGIYVGLVMGLSALLRGLISQENGVAIVLSTLAIAALFQPLRSRIQRLIDRRFYRRKYDAARTVAAFSATLRNEMDLEQLREQLLAVVQETMQPMHVLLWLRVRTSAPPISACSNEANGCPKLPPSNCLPRPSR
jgi:hypothetical protein